MSVHVVRLQSLELKNIKNVIDGTITMPKAFHHQLDYRSPEVLGIYGQNGSGKTAVIDALHLIWGLMTGRGILDSFYDYVNSKADTAEIRADFAIFLGSSVYDVTYDVNLEKTEDRRVQIAEESLSLAERQEGERRRKTVFLDFKRNSEDVLLPRKELAALTRCNKDVPINLLVAKKIAEKSNCSYIFGDSSREIFLPLERDNSKQVWSYTPILKALVDFAFSDLFVIRSSHSGYISANIVLPMAFCIDERSEHRRLKGDFTVSLREPRVLKENQVKVLHRIVQEINTVLYTIIPGMKIEDHDLGKQTMDDGSVGHKIELLSIREGMPAIPIRMESDGIIKIISILNALIQAFGNPSICLAIDELDAGIYEYMLGELLSVFAKSAKGQLIFTSHNLRPLEMLDKDSIIFSTANPKNRYIRMKNVKSTNNLRDIYIRSITLGGQNEVLYEDTDSLKIARAFRKAGRELYHVETDKESN